MPVRFVVGLGNPGPKYEYSRHNIGYRIVDQIAHASGVCRWCKGRSALIAEALVEERLIRLVMPRTFMNRSGRALLDLCEVFDAEPEEVLVVVDDVDLELGRLRIRPSGGPGTHNGLRSISQVIGDQYPRMRVGVRGKAQWPDLADFVLGDFTDDEAETVLQTTRRGAQAVQSAIGDGLTQAMNRFNRHP